MRKEDRTEIIHDALNYLDDDLIEDVDRLRGSEVEAPADFTVTKRKALPWRKWTTLAASICILVAGSLMMGDFLENMEPDRDSIGNTEAESENGNVAGEGELENMENTSKDDESEVLNTYENETELEDIVVGESEIVEGETEQAPPELEETDKVIVDGILGDIYQLKDNFVSVSMIPHKIWEISETEEEAYQQAVPIKEKYYDDFAKLVDALCEDRFVQVEESLQHTPNTEDMICHLFFEKKDGEVIHCWLLGDNLAFYHEKDRLSIIIEDAEIYDNIYKILAMHW